jgi:hypothetical protein
MLPNSNGCGDQQVVITSHGSLTLLQSRVTSNGLTMRHQEPRQMLVAK